MNMSNHNQHTRNGDPKGLDELLTGAFSDEFISTDDDEPRHTAMGFEDDSELDLGLDDEEEGCDKAPKASRGRRGRPPGTAQPKPEVRVRNPNEPCSVYERLEDFGLLRKVTDIVMAKTNCPWRLRADAVQEVHAHWASLPAKLEFEKNQVGMYAFQSGKHAVLNLRRGIGAVVAIPAAAFRTGRNSKFMESIGAAVNPRDVDDFKDSIELSVDPVDLIMLSKVSDQFLDERLEGLTLSSKQKTVVYMALVERKTVHNIADELGIELMYVERLMNQVTEKLNKRDSCPNKQTTPLASRASAGRRNRGPKKCGPTTHANHVEGSAQ